MSSIAKKMLERHGWKEGMGLGKNAQGVKTYVKVVRRDPHTATGLGHAADATQAPMASTFSVELDAVYSTLQMKKRKNQANRDTSDQEENELGEGSVPKGGARLKRIEKRARSPVSSSSTSSRSEKCSSSSDSDSDSDDDDNDEKGQVDITQMTDAQLFQRCGGVRLGRAGRHRFFDGKLRRIEKSHQGK